MTRAEGARSSPVTPWDAALDDFQSADPAMQRCLELARVAARTDLPLLILGETGTGKSLLARAIHNSSARAKAAFVSFNAAALSETLLDSQLFGHERGAFTGAHRQVKGKFEAAHAGTLFIDEVADMTPAAQAKILRAVEYGEFERLGSETLRVADVRLISATHWPLRQFLGGDRFRRDLFYRISGITITVPPLRDRPGDLRALIAAEILWAGRRQGKAIAGLDRTAWEVLMAHPWPGNLRELNRVIRAAVALSPGDIIPADALLLDAGHADHLARSADPAQAAHPATGHDLTLQAAEQHHIRHILELMGGNKRRAARALGVSRSTLDRKLSP
ncbi:MAG TPA: sigma 54-interacting transcriptional regulator [Candidatus Methylomirabilis sp.]